MNPVVFSNLIYFPEETCYLSLIYGMKQLTEGGNVRGQVVRVVHWPSPLWVRISQGYLDSFM